MTKGKFTYISTRHAAEAIKKAKQSTRGAARLLHLPESTVRKHLKRATDADARKSNRGRPALTDKHTKRRLTAWINRLPGPFTARTVQVDFFRNHECLDHSPEPHLRTVQRLLSKLSNVSKGLTRPRTELTERQKQQRVAYCKENLSTVWDDAYFGDEIILGLRGAWPWQPCYFSNTTFPKGPPAITIEGDLDKHKKKQIGQQRIYMWAAVSTKSWTSLVEYPGDKLTGLVYRVMLIDELQAVVKKDGLIGKALYIHDRDKAHIANATGKRLRKLKIREKLLGPKCWLLNPIEHIWGIFTIDLYNFGHKHYQNLDELRTAAKDAWNRVQETYHDSVQKMIEHLPRDMQRMIDAGGAHIDKM